MRLFLILVMLLVAGCSQLTAPSTAPTNLDDAAVSLPLPTLDELARATSALSGLERYGAEFLPFLANRVTAAGALGSFDPDFAGPGAPVSSLAFAAYQFDATGLSGAGSLEANWHTAPAAGNGVVGLSDWDSGRWDWRLLSGAGTSVELDDLAPYIHPDDGRLLALVLVGGTDQAHLTELELRVEPEMPHWRLSQLTTAGAQIEHLRWFELEGRPAVTYWRYLGETWAPTESKIILQRALDDLGSTWGPPEVVWDVPMTGGYTGGVGHVAPLIVEERLGLLVEVGGDDTEYILRVHYLYADDVSAMSFAAPTLIHEYTDGFYQVMEARLVDGRPAYLGFDFFNPVYYFKRANDAAGTSWSSVELDVQEWLRRIPPKGLVFADGFIGAFYPFETPDSPWPVELRFRRAMTLDGVGAWDTPQVVFPAPLGETPVYPVTLADGRPAFLYGEAPSLSFMTALDLLGDSWPLVGTVVPDMAGVSALEIEQVGGVPTLSYRRNDPEALYFRPAVDALGVEWEDPQLVYSGISTAAHMGEFNGHPILLVTLPGDGTNRYPVFLIYR